MFHCVRGRKRSPERSKYMVGGGRVWYSWDETEEGGEGKGRGRDELT